MRLKDLHKRNLVKAKKIIVDWITNHLIPQLFDSLTKLFEGKNINRKMTLRKQLKNVNIQNAKTMHSYFTRVSQIKEQLEAAEEEVENVEVVITTLNGLPRSWDSFIQGMCSRRKWLHFSRLQEEEEAWIIRREEKRGAI